MTDEATFPSQTGRMSPGAVALAVGLHVAIAGALWWLAPLDREDHAETPIMVTIDPQPLGGSGAAAASGGGAPETPAAEIRPPPPAEPVQQAAVAEPVPAPAEPPPAQAPPQAAEPTKPSEEEAEAAWQTEASAWKPHVTFEHTLPPPEPPPPVTSRDVPRPRPPQTRPPVQRAQTAFPPRPVQPPAPQPGNAQTAASTPGPTNSALDSLSGHGGERNDYLTRVFRHIEPFRAYPEAARVNRQRGRVVTRVTINRAGELVALSVDRSSGWPLIDNAELAAIRRAMPLPPPPAGMPGDPLVLILPMTYNYEGR